eukprot:CAMPEP_0175905480 /NCGR_PEP_ID=MMETSP0108-20121206/5034_1 /TAXON_ID=195067 ORGANISM="Goniomonas pacifica, Strain CCMP1869" /NCGR_SAMPLE_ID=MMETSP0108 /ASSEMBLY_ACC=CAM_ASM_000204 /LENGTH=57 /DNA_ID=CAMNT_0017227365 /DNA_START=58 /DNA_END=228 /DNA_ORIENTATION=+
MKCSGRMESGAVQAGTNYSAVGYSAVGHTRAVGTMQGATVCWVGGTNPCAAAVVDGG